jgi:hypothetical protein
MISRSPAAIGVAAPRPSSAPMLTEAAPAGEVPEPA